MLRDSAKGQRNHMPARQGLFISEYAKKHIGALIVFI
jgi:hypothetical protein